METLMEFLLVIENALKAAGFILEKKLTLPDLLALLAAFFATVYALFILPIQLIYKYMTSTTGNRVVLIEWLEQSLVLGKYQIMVSSLLNGLQSFYGKADSGIAFDRCLSIAMAYPIFLFFLAYVFFEGSHSFVGLVLFPEAASGRLMIFVSAMILCILQLPIIMGKDRLDQWARFPFNHYLKGKYQDLSYRTTMIIVASLLAFSVNADWKFVLLLGVCGGIYGVFAAIFSGAIFIFVIVANAGSGVLVVAIAVTIMIQGILDLVGVGAGAVAGAIFIAFITFFIFNSYILSYTLIVFWAIFPLLNAIFDWLSLRVSRFYLKIVKDKSSPLLILIDIAVDLVIAILFMLALVIVLPGVVEWFNALYSGFDPKAVIDWKLYAEQALSEPFGQGLMVTAMLITTLLPTLLHIFLGLFAFTVTGLFGKQLAGFLSKSADSTMIPMLAAIWIALYCYAVIAMMILLLYLFQTLLDLPIGLWLYSIAEWGHQKNWVVILILISLLVVSFYRPATNFFLRKSKTV